MTTTRDLFGERAAGEPATPGSYGLPPDGFRLPAATRLGPVRLQVGDLERSLAYYQEVLGMRVLEREPGRARLGGGAASPSGASAAASPLVELRERKGVRPAPSRSRTGLFHFALLLPERAALGRFLAHARGLGLPLGAGDHLVSESLYLQDPDGLGIEVYADRPQSRWRRVGRELRMATDPLDLPGLLEAAGDEPWSGMPAAARIGHLHLHVGDLDLAARFYSAALGFDRTVWGYPGALFFGAGGYHHHLGTNVWAGRTAAPPSADEAQLLDWTIELPDETSLETAAASLERAGFPAERGHAAGGEAELRTHDRWGTPVRLRVDATQEEPESGGKEREP
jgi:catechol 2,3-dioxygenase